MTMFDLLLRLYPASFRNEYGDELRTAFHQRRRTASGPGVVGLWLETIADTCTAAVAAHLDILRHDLSYAGRTLARAPGFAVVAIAIVALGIGATTAAFSVADAVLLRPLPFPQPSRLVKIWETTPGYAWMEFSAPNYRDWIGAARSYESSGVYHEADVTLMTRGEPRRLSGVSVSADLFPTLGVAPRLGRTFAPEDDRPGAASTVILSDRFWKAEFGADPSVVGRSVVLDGKSSTIIGVMPPTFHFPTSDTLLWITNRFAEQDYGDGERTNNWLEAVGRLRPGVSLQQARTEMDAIAAQSRQLHPKDNQDTGASVVLLGSEFSQRSRLLLMSLLGAAACVLLIACANLANLLLARALARRRELAVRAAIGAGRERLVRQLLTESLLLAIVGGALGIILAIVAVPLLAQLVPQTLPIAAAPSVDIRVMAFAALTIGATGIAFGLAPILRGGAAPDLHGLREGARAGGGQKERLRSALVVAEIVASVVLLVSAGLLIRALLTVQAIDPGFHAAGVLTMRSELTSPAYDPVARRQAFYSRVLAGVRAIPGVTAAGYISFLPMSSFRGGIWPVAVKGDAEAASGIRSSTNVAALRYVTPGVFAALGVPLKRGRDIADSDTRERAFVAVVSDSFARRYWPGEDPVGRHFTFAFADREIIGVVGDLRFRGLERNSEPQVYLSAQQVDDGAIIYYAPRSLAVRTTGDPAALTASVRAAIRNADQTVPITDVQTMTELVEKETASRSVQVSVLAAFAAIAFVLAAVGIHGLLSFTVSQRTQEIGVRVALGAQSRDILAMILRRGLLLAAAGIVPGAILAYVGGRSMEALLAGVPPWDGIVFASAIALSILMTVGGSIAPTLRALRVDPITALRSE